MRTHVYSKRIRQRINSFYESYTRMYMTFDFKEDLLEISVIGISATEINKVYLVGSKVSSMY